jgi:hypothetical protein
LCQQEQQRRANKGQSESFHKDSYKTSEMRLLPPRGMPRLRQLRNTRCSDLFLAGPNGPAMELTVGIACSVSTLSA